METLSKKLEKMSINNEWDFPNTIALLIGLTKYQDGKNLKGWTKEKRRDEDLYQTLISKGVNACNIVFLKDDQAIRSTIHEKLTEVIAKSDENSTFMFYFSGHGDRTEDLLAGLFLPYDFLSDVTRSSRETCLSTDDLIYQIETHFKGKKCVLTADCCYAGNLNKVATALEGNIDVLVMCSINHSNESTGSWIFTEVLEEIIRGKAYYSDRNDGYFRVKHAKKYIMSNLFLGANQVANVYHNSGVDPEFIISKNEFEKKFDLHGELREVLHENKSYRVRLIGVKKGKFLVHFLGWDDVWDHEYSIKDLSPVKPDPLRKIHKKGSKLKALSEGKFTDCEIVDVYGHFHLVTYPEYDSIYDEWITDDRFQKY